MNQDLIYLDDQLQDKQVELENDDTDEDLVPQNKIQAIKFENQVLDYIKDVTLRLVFGLIESKAPFIEMKSKTVLNNFRRFDCSSAESTQKLAIYFKLLSVIQDLIQNNQYSTKRDLYYQFKHLFKNTNILDSMINDISRTIGVPRYSLHILATPNGLMAGDLKLTFDDGSIIDCNHFNNGTFIPSLLINVKQIQTQALFVLIVEKYATFQRLIDDHFLSKYPAILITGRGVPDICSRQLINLLHSQLSSRLKFFCLTDANPYGIQIMTVYKYGSMGYKHTYSNLNALSLEWIGLKLADLDKFHLKDSSDEYVFKLNAADVRIAKSLIQKLTALNEFDLVNELQLMLEKNAKAELQYLQHIDNSFLCEVYLKAKLDSFMQNNLFRQKTLN